MIIGHTTIRERLRRSVENGKTLQAYLFFGPEGVGKFLVAREFACALIGGSGFGEDDAKQPLDLFILEPKREVEKGKERESDIGVEEVRDMRRELFLLPYAGKRRVLIVNNAHKLTESAQNALLKMLEEAPNHAVILLVTHDFGRMLPTVISRCQRIALSLVDAKEMKAWSSRFAETLEKYPSLSLLGRPGLLAEAAEHPEEFSLVWTQFEKMLVLNTFSLHERLAIAEKLSMQSRQAIRVLEWWLQRLHASAANTSDWEGIDRLEEAIRTLKKTPASSRLVLENLFVQWTV